jgi:hypothetical protein
VVAVAALFFVPVPLLDIMGGIRLSDSEALLRHVSLGICQLGVCSAPIWFSLALSALLATKPSWQYRRDGEAGDGRPSVFLWALVITSLAIWLVILPFTQPEQRLRYRVERDFAEGRIEAALDTMYRYSQDDFPPHWDPPPRTGTVFLDRPVRQIQDAWEVLLKTAPTEWVRESYVRKLVELLRSEPLRLSQEKREELHQLLQQLPEGQRLQAQVEQEEGRPLFQEPERDSKRPDHKKGEQVNPNNKSKK